MSWQQMSQGNVIMSNESTAFNKYDRKLNDLNDNKFNSIKQLKVQFTQNNCSKPAFIYLFCWTERCFEFVGFTNSWW